MGKGLLINIAVPDLKKIAVMSDAGTLRAHLQSAVEQQVKLALYVNALVERLVEMGEGQRDKGK